MAIIPAFDVKKKQSEIIDYLQSIFDTSHISLDDPSTNAKMPYMTVSMRTEPQRYSLKYSEISTLVTVEIRVWDKLKTSVLDLVTQLGNAMRQVGFARSSQTGVVKDGTIGKFTKSEIYRANYNGLSGKYELRQ